MCHRAQKIIYPSPSYGKGPCVHGWTTSWLSCQQTDSDQWCIIHIFNLNPVHLDLGNELHRQFVAWISWYQYFWPNSISKNISLIIFWKLYFGCNLLFWQNLYSALLPRLLKIEELFLSAMESKHIVSDKPITQPRRRSWRVLELSRCYFDLYICTTLYNI